MSRYIDYDAIDYRNDKMHNKSSDFIDGVIYIAQRIEEAPSINIVKCVNCRKCKEQGGHANCNGYLYCTRQKTIVDEDCFCSWGEER